MPSTVDAPTLETERLLLRPLGAADVPAWLAMYADAEFARGLGYPAPLGEDEAWRGLAIHVGQWTLRGFGMWGVVQRHDPGTFLGRVGFFQPAGWPGFELGWAIARPHWGRGFASEAARTALAYAFDVLEQPRVISLVAPENHRSASVARKLGERIVDRVQLRGHDADVWAIERDEWMRSRR